ncbi:MAG: (Fe-S)-binding protein [Chloroflexi bacterium]|nr:(Fe-S)-binding protein [Chloroflexota bacterium]
MGSSEPRIKSGFNYARQFGEIPVLVDLQLRPEQQTWLAKPPKDPEPIETVLYLGCNVLRTSHIVATLTDILERLGTKYQAVGGPAYCCGIVHHRNGDTEVGYSLGDKMVRYFEAFQPERVVMFCPSCISTYEELLEAPGSFEALSALEYLAERIHELEFLPATKTQRVALHYHTGHEFQDKHAAALRTILGALPGVELVDLGADARLGRICAPHNRQAAGPELWDNLMRSSFEAAAAAEVDVYATIYHGCQRQHCLSQPHWPFQIEHYLTVVGRALGIAYEDKYRQWAALGDVDRIMADAEPCMRANGADVAAIRPVLERVFLKK